MTLRDLSVTQGTKTALLDHREEEVGGSGWLFYFLDLFWPTLIHGTREAEVVLTIDKAISTKSSSPSHPSGLPVRPSSGKWAHFVFTSNTHSPAVQERPRGVACLGLVTFGNPRPWLCTW
jgi:hypothetical protein